MKTILITGGAGFIGSHACVALEQAEHQLVILDNLCNSRADVIDRLATLCGKRPVFIQGEIRDSTILAQQLLHWKATRGLEQMCADAWRWQQGSVALGYLHSDNG